MQIIRAASCRRMPWKNGGGETVEIATDPEGAGLDSFAWRLSAARVAQDGPFSQFPGIDRTLAVLSGAGLELRIAGTVTRLDPNAVPLSFPGDQPTEAHLLGGPIEDLNIMTRRGVARHRMRRVTMRGATRFELEGETVLLFCAEGQVSCGAEVLHSRDTAVLRHAGGEIGADGQGVLYVIEIASARP